MRPLMIDVFLNGNLVAVIQEDLLKLFLNAVLGILPPEFSVSTRIHNENKNASVVDQSDADLLNPKVAKAAATTKAVEK